MNPSLSQTIPFPAGIGLFVEVITGDGVVVEISEVEFASEGDVEFVVIVGETVVVLTAVGSTVVELDDGVLVVKIGDVLACALVVSGRSVGLGVVVKLGLAAWVVGLPSLVD